MINFQNFTTWKINNFSAYFHFGKLSKFQKKLANFEIVCPFDIPHYSQLRWFWYLPFDINYFRRFIGSLFIFIVVTRKFGRFTFERSLIFKFEMLAILKLDCSKFEPSPRTSTSMELHLYDSGPLQKKKIEFYIPVCIPVAFVVRNFRHHQDSLSQFLAFA